LKAAIIQMACSASKGENVAKAEERIAEAAEAGAELVCLQELFVSLYFPAEIDERHFDLAETIPGPTTDRLSALARERGVALLAPLFERTVEGIFFNTCAVIDRQGELLGVYRKSSIPVTRMTETLVGCESFYFRPGDTGFRTFDLACGIRVGILICYDRHFPEAFRCLALGGAQLIVTPTATCGYSRAFWELELRAMAAQNLVFVGAPNRVGHDFGADWYGTSLWIDPSGHVLSSASDSEEEILYVELDLAEIARMRRKWGFYRDRRPELYGRLVE
jgi:predicted amidohydrolase